MEKNKKLNFIAEICQNHQGKFSNVEKMINDGSYENFLKQRYEQWASEKQLMTSMSLEDIHKRFSKSSVGKNNKITEERYFNLWPSFEFYCECIISNKFL